VGWIRRGHRYFTFWVELIQEDVHEAVHGVEVRLHGSVAVKFNIELRDVFEVCAGERRLNTRRCLVLLRGCNG